MMLWFPSGNGRKGERLPKSLPAGIRLAAAIVLLWFAPLLVFAAGLGRLTVLSALGQPLDAEIEIVSLLPGEEEGLTARLAPAEAFRQAGIELTPVLLGARFSIERRAGRPYVRMRTTQPVHEPFLDVLVELQWATGRLVREYTFLLDPPGYRAPVAVAAAPAAAPKPEPAPGPPAPKVEARPIPPAATPAPTTVAKHEVRKGETLGSIARRNLPEGVTLNQMLIALFRANPDAFVQGNINLVRAGRILEVPSREAVAAVDLAEAERLVQSHAAQFAEYRRALGAAVAAAPAASRVAEREVAGRIEPKPRAPTPAATRDELRLSRLDPAKAGAPATRAAIEDDRIARERALKEAQSRIAELERNVAELQKLLELRSQQLAALEKKAAAVGTEPTPKPATEAAKRAPEAAKPAAEAPKGAEVVARADAPKTPEAAKPVADPVKAPEPGKPAVEMAKAREPAKTAEDPGKAAVKPPAEAKAPKPKPAPAKAPEPGVVDQVLDFVTDPVSGGGLAAVLVLLAGYAFLQVRRRRAAQRAGFQDSVLGAASGAATPSVLGTAAQQPAAAVAAGAAGAAVAVAAAAQPATTAEAEELDPTAEADVYMAYGRYAQAEEILKEALAKDPERLAVHAKLLELYASQKNAQAFEQTALKVKSLTGGSGPEWEKALALGYSVDPSNPLYGTAAESAATAAPTVAAPSLDFDLGAGAPEVSAEASTADATAPLDFELETAAVGPDAVKPDAGAPLDFDLGASGEKTDFVPVDTLELDSEETRAAAGGLDFELDTTRVGAAAVALEEPAKPVQSDQTLAMEFDLDLDLGETKEDKDIGAAATSAGLGAVGLDSAQAPEPAGEAEAKWRRMSEKLELSRAYLDIGQKEEARELLDEVVREGDAAQQARAREMLAGLG